MPGKVREKSAAEKTADNAKGVYERAKDKFEKSKSPADKTAMEAANTAFKNASKAAARDRFETIGGSRVALVVTKLAAFTKLANPRAYSFTQTDIDAAFKFIRENVDSSEAEFKNALAGGTKSVAASKFKFG